MNELPINIVHNISTYLQMEDYKQFSLCNKYLYNTISNLYENKNESYNLNNLNIYDLYKIIHKYHDSFQKYKLTCNNSLKFDIEWCIERFHSERIKKTNSLTFEQRNIINKIAMLIKC